MLKPRKSLPSVAFVLLFSLAPATFFGVRASGPDSAGAEPRSRAAASRGGLVENIPAKYKGRYQVWKSDLLSTESGRGQWEAYALNPRFTLTVVVSDDDRHGAGTGAYKWDDSGQLVAATITLGSRIDEGFPNPIYYPVMDSLWPRR